LLIAACLFLAAATLIPLAFRERATAAFLAVFANEAWSREASRATLEQASQYNAVFRFDLAIAVLLAVIGTSLLPSGGRSRYGASALAAAFAAAAGIWAFMGDRPHLGGGLPAGVLAAMLTAAAGIAAIGSLTRWWATAPLELRRPLNPPVPPSHQAG
jgi:hypothetical protein